MTRFCDHTAKVARKLKIDFAPAMIGWKRHKLRMVPNHNGIVVCSEFVDDLLKAYESESARIIEEEKKKRIENGVRLWCTLARALLVDDDLRNGKT